MAAIPEEFKFIPPPEAPVFKPTWEEFQDALAYINKIRPIAEQAGICKIIPPPDWQPPFAVDVDNFKFTPRIQRINELEAHTRIKLNFLDQIAKFWELQGSSLKIPCVEKRPLDLYSLHKHVQIEGGAELCTKDRKWNNKIVSRMGFPLGKNIGATLKMYYEKIIHPYDIFNKGKSIPVKSEVECDDQDSTDKDYKPHKIPSRMAGKIPESEKNGRRSKRYPDNQNEIKIDSDDENKGGAELKRLMFHGAGPKMAALDIEKVEEKGKTRGKKIDYFDYDPLAKYICLNCGRGDAEDQMLLCDGCDDSYHTFCLVPRLPEIPKGDWRCPKCVAVEVSKPLEAFGFEQAQKEYTLQSFGEMADKFKQDYFNMPVHLVPYSLAEQEFWRIVSSIDEDVTVEYGADLHTMDHGSGFPTKSSKNLLPADQEYASSSWNLNNLPVLEGSVLGHINCDISGMKVPWMYVGMCFSTFCWHNEDHWSYSINYLHWGEPKTWYGVPGSQAEIFESAMRDAASELFEAQPDLLHQLVTIMNPNIIMKNGVSIVRTDQQAGEFVITFPRAYHAGFNQGYNFAEAVNFCPADWLSIGRECVVHYNNLKRYCVFSHDELVCKMATCPHQLDLTVAAATYQDLLKMVNCEKKQRRELALYGVKNASRESFEILQDDERQCDHCKTTCFLSALSCTCNNEKIVCLPHYKLLCECPAQQKTLRVILKTIPKDILEKYRKLEKCMLKLCTVSDHLRYRYTLDELPPMLESLKIRAESFDNWAEKVRAALDAGKDDKLEYSDLKALVDEAEEQSFPDSELLQTLIQSVRAAEKCSMVASHLSTSKIRTRTRVTGDSKDRLTLEELRLFYEQIELLACKIPEADKVRDIVKSVVDFEKEVTELFEEERPQVEDVEEIYERGSSFDIDLPQLTLLKCKLHQVQWLDEVEECFEDTETLTLQVAKKLYEEGLELRPSPKIEETTRQLYDLMGKMTLYEKETKDIFADKITLSKGQQLVTMAESIAGHLPIAQAISDAVKKAKEWNSKMKALLCGDINPLLEQVEWLINKGRGIPVVLPHFEDYEEHVRNAHNWVEDASRVFLKKNSHFTLCEVLLPRTDIGLVSVKRKRLRNNESAQQQMCNLLEIDSQQLANPSQMVEAYLHCQERELRAMRAIRSHNKAKNDNTQFGLATFCICQKPAEDTMIHCTLCLEQFHVNCIPIAYRMKVKLSGEGRFICSSCERSQRPQLKEILDLLCSLRNLPIRVPEGEALQNLTERAMSWQDGARLLLEDPQVNQALQKLNKLSKDALGTKDMSDDPLDIDGPNCSLWSGLDWASSGPIVSFDDQLKQKLTLQLVEGELLEVSLDETTKLWRLLRAATSTRGQVQSTLVNMNKSIGGAYKEKKKRKSDTSDKADKTDKKRKLVQPGTGKKKTGRVTKINHKPRQTKTTESSSDSDDTVDESCAANNCRHPTGSNVEWVQCDGCDLWFHYMCVGLRPHDLSEDDEYICLKCQAAKTNFSEEESVDLLLSLANSN